MTHNNKRNALHCGSKSFAIFLLLLRLSCLQAELIPQPGWEDSYSDGKKCFCRTTFDHNIAGIVVDTPAGNKTIKEVCDALGSGPELPPGEPDERPIYNDIQCGNGPVNDAGDEEVCPGRTDLGAAGCKIIGPRWNLTVFTTYDDDDMRFPPESDPWNVPGAFPSEKYAMSRKIKRQSTIEAVGEKHVALINNNDMVEYNVSVAESGTYNCTMTIASDTEGGRIVMWDRGVLLASVTVNNTDGWQKWANVSSLVNLQNTTSSLRLVFAGHPENFLLNIRTLYFDFLDDEA